MLSRVLTGWPWLLGLAAVLALGLGLGALGGPGGLHVGVALAALVLLCCLGLLAWGAVRLGREARALHATLMAIARGESLEPRPAAHPGLAALAEAAAELVVGLRAEEEAAERAAWIQERDRRRRALQRLAAGVMRDLQQPLAGVIGFAEMALKTPLPEQARTYLQMVTREARLSRDALERLSAFAEPPELSEAARVELAPLLEELAREFGEQGGPGALRPRVHVAPGLPHARADRDGLRALLVALLDNARAALGAGPGQIELAANAGPLGVCLVVRDTGPGLPEESVREGLGTPCFGPGPARLASGMSLALADARVARWGGRLEFASRPGQGLAVFVHLRAGPTSASP
jgi:signal transduction histidine kinase